MVARPSRIDRPIRSDPADTAIARPPCGPVRGSRQGEVACWRGIPYAHPPIGPLRWRPPRPMAPWRELRDARAFGPDLPQCANPRFRAPCHDEDALVLNVWAPAGAAPGSLPVLAWFHGGGFAGGSASDARTDGACLAAQGVVVVGFNYRVGLFGFLAHPALSAESEHGTSGNYGLLDQIAALRWIQENVAAFGGDADRITAVGVSAGSASISLLLASPFGRGLFRQAILHSPGAGRPLAALADAEQAGLALGKDLAALRALPAAELFARTDLLAPAVRKLTTPRVLRPIRDAWILPEDERPVFKAGRLQALPLIVGSTADEGSLLTCPWPIDTLAAYDSQIEANFPGAQNEARALYPAGEHGPRAAVADMFADTQFNYGVWLLAQAMARREPRTWRYLFTRRAPGHAEGPHHGEDVAYPFGTLAYVPGADDTDRHLADVVQAAWVAFARSGDPNRAGGPRWDRYDPAADNHLEFGDRITAGARWRRSQIDFLDRYWGEPRAFARARDTGTPAP